VNRRSFFVAEAVVPCIVHNANNLVASAVLGVESKAAPERILVWKEVFRETLINDDRFAVSANVAMINRPTGQKWNAQRLEESFSNPINSRSLFRGQNTFLNAK